MEQHQAQAEIERILDQVHSLDDLSVDDIIELRNASEQSIVLDKFKISPTQYHDWLSNVAGGESVRGMEYDAQNACIVLKGRPGLTHEAATSVVHVFLDRIREKLETATGSFYFLTGSKGR